MNRLHHLYASEDFTSLIQTLDLIETTDSKPNSATLTYRGLALKALGRLDEALLAFNTGLHLTDDSNIKVQLITYIKRCQMLQGRDSSSLIPVPERKIDESSDGVPVPLAHSSVAAMTLAEISARLAPTDTAVQLKRGLALRDAGAFASALRAFNAAAALGNKKAIAEAEELHKIIFSFCF